ncbi:MAG TPA: rRNA maturation RNase YbeY [bacterium]|mgnify:FL=1|nr:rRNA maturation RNase YbeY [bacterium]
MRIKKLVEFRLKNHQRKVKIDCTKVMSALEKSRMLFPAPPSHINVTLVSNTKIKELNRKFLNKNTLTDVLSFKLSPDEGEIIISAEMATENGKNYGITVEYEVLYLIIHGYLHLKNYTDYKEREREEMFKIQDRIFYKVIKSIEKKDERK